MFVLPSAPIPAYPCLSCLFAPIRAHSRSLPLSPALSRSLPLSPALSRSLPHVLMHKDLQENDNSPLAYVYVLVKLKQISLDTLTAYKEGDREDVSVRRGREADRVQSSR